MVSQLVGWLVIQSVHYLVGPLVGSSVDWLVGRLVCWSVGWSVGWSVDWLVVCLIGWLVGLCCGFHGKSMGKDNFVIIEFHNNPFLKKNQVVEALAGIAK